MNLATSGLRSRLRQARALARLWLGQAPAVPAVSVDDLAVAQGLRELPVTYRRVLACTTGSGSASRRWPGSWDWHRRR